MYDVLERHFGGKRYLEYHYRKSPSYAKEWLHFSVVRNPYSRAVASWMWALKTEGGSRVWKDLPDREFETYAKYLTTTTQAWFPMIAQGEWLAKSKVSRVIKIERLEDAFFELPFVTERIEMPKLNPTDHPHWRELMTPSIVDAVRLWAGDDFGRYGYDIDDV